MTDSSWPDGTVLTLPERPPVGNGSISKPPLPPSDPRSVNSLPTLPTPAAPTTRSGWRMVVAFTAGALLSAGSFGLGMLWNAESRETATATAPLAAPPSEAPTTPDSSPSGGATPSTDPGPTQTIAAVAATLGPSVVQVETDRGLGSGVVYADGLVMTNHHVVDGASQIRVRTSAGRTIDARLAGSDGRNDIAVLDLGPGSDVAVAPLAIDSSLAVGDQTIAIGSPFQLQQTVTAGIVSALNRPVPNNGAGMTAMIQTDAPINPGNSGGALANAAGEVIGINTSIRTDGNSNSNVGIGFAVPIDTAFDVAQRITSGAPLEAGVLGVQASTSPDDEVGVVIGDIVADGAAASAGLVTGDRVLSLDGAPVTNFAELVGLVQSHFAGDTIELVVVRGSQTLTVVASLN